MKKSDPVVLTILGLTIIVFIGIVIAASLSSSQSSIPSYHLTDQEKPALKLSERSFDFGKMRVTDKKTKEILVENVGNKPLVLSNFSTSCDCTSVVVVSGSERSPEFTMHSNSRWQKELAPGDSAFLEINYQPSLMPVQGAVSRAVFLKTNDPQNPQVTIEFSAFVE